MHSLRRAVPLALAVGLIAAIPGAAQAAPAKRAPVARTAGSDAGPPVFPGLVNTRMIRTQKALDRAVDYADDGQSDKAISALYQARLQVKLAWRAAKYQIENAPPPPPPGDGLTARRGRRIPVLGHAQRTNRRHRHRRSRAHKSGAPVGGGSTTADQYTTAGAVLDLQHTVAQTAIGMIDMAHGKLRDSLSRTLFTALDQRDAAVAYIHSIDTPPPPGDGLAARASRAPVAHTSGAPVGGTWSTAMSPISGEIDDEINQIDGVISLSSTLGAGIRRILQDAEFQAVKTQRAVNQYWPPAPVGD
jgi:hypothetical protein